MWLQKEPRLLWKAYHQDNPPTEKGWEAGELLVVAKPCSPQAGLQERQEPGQEAQRAVGTLGELGGALSPVLTICPSGAQAHQVPGHASPCGVLCWGGWGNCPLVIPKAGKVGGLLALLDHGPGDAAAGPAPSVLLSEELESTPHPSLAKAEQVTRRLGPATNTLGQLGPTGHRAIRTPAPPPNPSAELSPSPSTPPPRLSCSSPPCPGDKKRTAPVASHCAPLPKPPAPAGPGQGEATQQP